MNIYFFKFLLQLRTLDTHKSVLYLMRYEKDMFGFFLEKNGTD